jgi:hypothetical protein
MAVALEISDLGLLLRYALLELSNLSVHIVQVFIRP